MLVFSVLFPFMLFTSNQGTAQDDLAREFNDFKTVFNKQYAEDEEEMRLNNFLKNKVFHDQLKFKPHLGAEYGVTKFWDLTPQEFKDLYLSDFINDQPNVGEKQHNTHPDRFKHLGIPEKLDWRTHLNFSALSPIKNQKKCGGCWAFSTVEMVESMYSIQTGKSPPPTLSVQEVIDCASNNYGCQGGDTCRALQWMTQTQPPIIPEIRYPLTDVSNFCKMITDPSGAVYVHNYTCNNNVGREDETLQMLQHGPLAAAVDATSWYNYQGGIIQYHCGIYDNHAVQIVGYDLTGDVPHYIIRNSWGTDFGHNGFIYVKIGENVCGIAQRVSSVFVKV